MIANSGEWQTTKVWSTIQSFCERTRLPTGRYWHASTWGSPNLQIADGVGGLWKKFVGRKRCSKLSEVADKHCKLIYSNCTDICWVCMKLCTLPVNDIWKPLSAMLGWRLFLRKYRPAFFFSTVCYKVFYVGIISLTAKSK